MTLMKFYSFRLSGHAHRVRLFLSVLGMDYELVEVDVARGETRLPAHLHLNPLGQVPVLVDGDLVMADSTAILVYLAKRYAPPGWLPDTPVEAAQVQRWLSIASGEIAYGLAAARLITLFGLPFDAEEAIGRAHAVLAVLDETLAQRDWVVGGAPTIADLALYSYVERAPEGNVDRSAYANVNRWLARIEALPGFMPLQRSAVGLEAAANAGGQSCAAR